MTGQATKVSHRMNGQQIVDATCDSVRKALGRDCLLAGHLCYQDFYVSGGLEVQLQLDQQRIIRTRIVIQQGAFPHSKVCYDGLREAGELNIPAIKVAFSTEVTSANDVEPEAGNNLERLHRAVTENPGATTNQLVSLSRMRRVEAIRLLGRYQDVLWRIECHGQARCYFPL
jgi:hypothetical protein